MYYYTYIEVFFLGYRKNSFIYCYACPGKEADILSDIYSDYFIVMYIIRK